MTTAILCVLIGFGLATFLAVMACGYVIMKLVGFFQ